MIGKILEAILKNGIQPIIDNGQNDTQRGFTANMSTLIATLTVEEFIRRFKFCYERDFMKNLSSDNLADVI